MLYKFLLICSICFYKFTFSKKSFSTKQQLLHNIYIERLLTFCREFYFLQDGTLNNDKCSKLTFMDQTLSQYRSVFEKPVYTDMLL